MRFTPAQVAQLSTIVDRHTHLFIGVHVGRDFLTTPMLRQLAAQGIELPLRRIPNHFDAAFRFGMLSVHPGGLVAPTFSYDHFKRYLERGEFRPLLRREKIALNRVRRRAYLDLTSLSHEILDDLTTEVAPTADATTRSRALLRTLRSEGQDSHAVQAYAAQVAQHAQDWAVRFHRIASYVMHDAFDLGRAYGLLAQTGGATEVYKDVYAGACPTCIRLYLTAEIGSEPRRFSLLSLLANGHNIGRKAPQLLPVIGPTHPGCSCTLYPCVLGETWDAERGKFIPVRAINPEHSERIRSRKGRVKTVITP
jgi:hypothetical protein